MGEAFFDVMRKFDRRVIWLLYKYNNKNRNNFKVFEKCYQLILVTFESL